MINYLTWPFRYVTEFADLVRQSVTLVTCYDLIVSMPVAAVRPAMLTLFSFFLSVVTLTDAMRSLDVSLVMRNR